jgi:LacI family transcriptional regulator
LKTRKTAPAAATTKRRRSSNRPANIHDVARAAGVSIKTVSRVLNKEPKVSPETKERVLAAVSHLSYRPNIFARALKSENSLLIGLLFDNPSASYVAGLQFGAMAQCRADGYHLIVEILEMGAPDLGDRVNSLVRDSNLQGVIVTPPLCDSRRVLTALTRVGTPFVRIAPGSELPGALSVSIDDAQGAFDLTKHLIGLGHTRIGFIHGDPVQLAASLRLNGYRAALAESGIAFDPALCAQGYFSYQSGMQAAHQLLSLPNRPTAIFASNDDMAAAALAVANRFNLRIPEDLSVVGFDDSLVAQVVWPRLTTCRQPIADMAAAAVQMLTSKDEIAVRARQLQHEIIVRESSGPPARAR